MGVKGFPTLKIVRPSKKTGKPIVEDYQGPRESDGIAEAVKRAIPNNVKRITDKGLDAWLEEDSSTAKAILFSDKGPTSALTKVLANEFIGKINFAQIRDKEESANAKFGVTQYPTLLILPKGSAEPVVYDDAFKKSALLEFLTKHAPSKDKKLLKEKVKEAAQKVVGKDTEEEPPKPDQEEKAAFSSASSSQKAEEIPVEGASATAETLEDDSNPTESPKPAVTPEAKPIILSNVPSIPSLEAPKELSEKCLGEKTSTCVFALLPKIGEAPDAILGEPSTEALASLAGVAEKHKERNGHLFPFYSVPASNPSSKILRDALQLNDENTLELIAVNGRRNWVRRFETGRYDSLAVETWIDNIRFGEGSKGKLPEELLGATEAVTEEKTDESAAAEEPTPEAENLVPPHEEL